MAKKEQKKDSIDQEFMIKYCQEHGQVEWLKEQVQKTYIDKKGKERRVSWVQVRSKFEAKFFPKKTTSFYDRVMGL